jgi:hypothetical protein
LRATLTHPQRNAETLHLILRPPISNNLSCCAGSLAYTHNLRLQPVIFPRLPNHDRHRDVHSARKNLHLEPPRNVTTVRQANTHNSDIALCSRYVGLWTPQPASRAPTHDLWSRRYTMPRRWLCDRPSRHHPVLSHNSSRDRERVPCQGLAPAQSKARMGYDETFTGTAPIGYWK